MPMSVQNYSAEGGEDWEGKALSESLGKENML